MKQSRKHTACLAILFSCLISLLAALPAQSSKARLEVEAHLGGSCTALGVDGERMIKGEGRGMGIYDIQDVNKPVHLGGMPLPETVAGMTGTGDQVYVSNRSAGLLCVSVKDPANPVIAGRWKGTGQVWDAALSGERLYVAAGGDGLVILDVSRPDTPVEVKRFDTPGDARGVRVQGTRAFIADGNGGLMIVSIADPSNPSLLGSHPQAGRECNRIRLGDNNLACVLAADSEILLNEVSNPSAIEPLAAIPVSQAQDFTVQGSLLVAAGRSGYDLYDISNPRSPVLKLHQTNARNLLSLGLDGDRLYLGDSAGTVTHLRVVPPFQTSLLATWNGLINVQEIALSDTAVHVLDSRGVIVIDQKNPLSPVFRGRVNAGFHYDIASSGDRAFLSGSNLTEGFAHLVDASSPDNPALLGPTAVDGSTVDAAVNASVAVTTSGRFRRLWLYDLLSNGPPALLTEFTLPEYGLELDVVNETAYVNIETIGFAIVDIKNPRSPRQIGLYTLDSALKPLDIAAQDSLVYLLIQNRGLMILDCTNPANIRRLGFEPPSFSAFRIAVSGKWVIAATQDKTVLLIDVSNPALPVIADTLSFTQFLPLAAASGNRVCVVEDGLTFYRIVEDAAHFMAE